MKDCSKSCRRAASASAHSPPTKSGAPSSFAGSSRERRRGWQPSGSTTGPKPPGCVRLLGDARPATSPETLGDFVDYIQVNDRFHRQLWTLSKNPVLVANIEQVLRLPFAAPGALVFGEAELPEARRTAQLAQAQHEAIVDAIERRQGARAEALAREHALIAWENLQRAFGDRALFGRIPGAALVRVPTAV